MDRKVEQIDISDIPRALDDSIRAIIANYTVGFLRIENGEQGINPILLGSGTLVTANGIYAILTAHHVGKSFQSEIILV